MTTTRTEPTPQRPEAEVRAALDAEDGRLTAGLANVEADIDACCLEAFTRRRPADPGREHWLRERREQLLAAQDRVRRARRQLGRLEPGPTGSDPV